MDQMTMKWDNISPIDTRYFNKILAPFLSENASMKAKLEVEFALATALFNRGVCSAEVLLEIQQACQSVTTEEVYAEEDITKHDIRAMVNCIQAKVSDAAKPIVHMTATSFDIIDTANILRYKRFMKQILIPELKKLLNCLMRLSHEHADTPQVARSHGQHAVPFTFGASIAEFVDRVGENIIKLTHLTDELKGKFSGAVGTYNASSLFFSDPEAFEAEVLANVELKPARISTQIAPPEPLMRVLGEIQLGSGVIGNFARNNRNLQRTEIAEVGEAFAKGQVGSSTMPQKRNPINFENVESSWKILMGRYVTVMLDQISDHQRDLTGSASGRTYGEIFGYFFIMVNRMTKTIEKLEVDRVNMDRNLGMTRGAIGAEPLQILLSSLGHPDAHEAVRVLMQDNRESGQPLSTLMQTPEFAPYLERMTPDQIAILEDPGNKYRGIAPKKANDVSDYWADVMAED